MQINAGDTAWVLVSAAMVLLMTPGLAFFYGGLVGSKNVLSTLMHSFIIIAVIGAQWMFWGYTLAFGPDKWGIIGGLEWFGLKDVGLAPNPDYAPTIPHQAFMIYQGMFAIITPALISGAFAERIKFKAFLAFTLLWATFVYDPLAHWVWGAGGWLREFGVLDFAGGLVVHISAGVASLTAAWFIKPRMGYGKEAKAPHNIPFVVLGAGLLWFGWFGFNAGSALGANELATSAFVATSVAATSGALAWMTMSWWFVGAPSVVGAVSGAVVGLAAVTPASGFVAPVPAFIIGLGAGVFCFLATRLRAGWKNMDDALDVWACHGVGSTWGVIAVGLFGSLAINAAGANGLFNGNNTFVLKQLLGVAVTWVFSFVMTLAILWVVNKLIGLRVSEPEEERGLDISQHGESAYV